MYLRLPRKEDGVMIYYYWLSNEFGLKIGAFSSVISKLCPNVQQAS